VYEQEGIIKDYHKSAYRVMWGRGRNMSRYSESQPSCSNNNNNKTTTMLSTLILNLHR